MPPPTTQSHGHATTPTPPPKRTTQHRPRRPLTRKQATMFRLIADMMERKGFAPTMQELADTLHISKAAVHDRVEAIIDSGCLDKPQGKLKRALVITEIGRRWLDTRRSSSIAKPEQAR